MVDERVSHILVLSDSPDVDAAVNERIEAGLRAIDAGFAVTIPFAVDGLPAAIAEVPQAVAAEAVAPRVRRKK